MRTKAEIISALKNPGIIAVIRAQSAAQIIPASEALLAGGVIAIEITMTTPNAIAAVRDARQKLGDRALIGIGTVMDVENCRAAIEAGAEFVVSPICRTELVPIARAAGRPVMLGAYTPTEAQVAYEAGSDFIKIFPAETLGTAFIKSVHGPLPHLRIVPTGGIDVHNVADFLNAGCEAVGIGGSLVSSKILQDGDWPELTKRARAFVNAAAQARK